MQRPHSTPRSRFLTDVVAENWLFASLITGYVVVAAIILAALGRPWRPVLFRPTFAAIFIGFSALALAAKYLLHPRRFWRAWTPAGIAGAMLIAGLAVPAQSVFQALKQSIGPVIGFRWDPLLERLDTALHGGRAWELYILIWPAHLLALMNVLYVWWFLGLIVFLVWAGWMADRELRVRALTAFALLWVVGGTIVAGLFSSAGPCFLDRLGLANSAYQPLFTLLDGSGAWVRNSQDELWGLLAAGTPRTFGGVSAFPSMHVAVATLWALVASKRSRVVWLGLSIYAAVIQIGSVLLAWHYAVDGYAGAILAFASWHLAGRLQAITVPGLAQRSGLAAMPGVAGAHVPRDPD